jgi:hypothetical protein
MNEPVGILFGLASDWAELGKNTTSEFLEENKIDYGELVANLIASFTENITNKTFLTGLSDALNVAFNPERYGEKWVQRFLSSFIPTASYYARKGDDPLIRDSQSLLDSIYNRIPGQSQKLPARRNVFGETIEYSEGYAPDILGKAGKTFSPIYTSKATDDVVFNELVRLNITPSTPRRSIGGVKLTSKQYEGLMSEMLSLKTKQKLEQLIKSDGWKKLTDQSKTDYINSIIRKDQKMARDITELKDGGRIYKDQVLQLIKELNQ